MPFLFILFGCIAVLLAFLRSPSGKGWFGEWRVKMVLGKTEPGVRYVINDFKCRVSDSKTTQIDHIVINQSGIYVIETKNYSGRIYGQENQLEWTQVLNYGKVKNKLYNPIKQNKTHVYHILNILGKDIPVVSAVVFVQGNTQYINASGVYNLKGLKLLVRNELLILSPQEMDALYNKLLEANDKTITNTEHVNNINNIKTTISHNVCPRCGKKLVMRQGKNGLFMGCEGFPTCRFTKKC